MEKHTKIIRRAVLIVILVLGTIMTLAVYCFTHWTEKNVVTDIGAYESYFGAGGIHRTRDTEAWKKTRESYLVLSDIFPEKLPDSAEAEDFYYEYYNPWDPCYLSYLVYHCNEDDYDAEAERLKQIPMPEDYLIYGALEFPYPLLAVNTSYYGYIYAMGDEAQRKIIYVELTFCNYFTDIDYENVIPVKYLPIGFDVKQNNPVHLEFKAEIERSANGGSLPEDTTADTKADKADQAETYEAVDLTDSLTSAPEEDENFYQLATSLSRREVENFAKRVKQQLLFQDWKALSEEIAYPITMDDVTYHTAAEFLTADIKDKQNPYFFIELEEESCSHMFCDWKGIMLGETGRVWLMEVMGPDSSPGELKIRAINGLTKSFGLPGQIAIKEDSINSKVITLLLENETDLDVSFGADYRLQKYEHDTYVDMEPLTDSRRTDGGVNRPKRGNPVKWTLNVGEIYGELATGEYRVCMSVSVSDDKEKYERALHFLIE